MAAVNDMDERSAWQDYGACRGKDIETFIPSVGSTFTKARVLCQRCTVRQECLDFAMADEDIVGMWGGTTMPERQEMRQSRGVT